MQRFYRALYAAAGLVLRCVFPIPLECRDEALCVVCLQNSVLFIRLFLGLSGNVMFKIHPPVPWGSESVLVRGFAMIRTAVLV